MTVRGSADTDKGKRQPRGGDVIDENARLLRGRDGTVKVADRETL
jgi:hypothetical protein